MPAVTKRSRALAPEKPSGFSEDAAGREEEAFAARVAVHLREFASKRRKRLGGDEAAASDGWTAETADARKRVSPGSRSVCRKRAARASLRRMSSAWK